MFRWRVGLRWYAVALLTAPLLWVGIQGALSLTSNVYVPMIVTVHGEPLPLPGPDDPIAPGPRPV